MCLICPNHECAHSSAILSNFPHFLPAVHHVQLPVHAGRMDPWTIYDMGDMGEAVPRTPWLGYGIQPVSGPLTSCTEGKTPVDAAFRAVKPRIGNRCTASGDLCIRISGINRVLFSYCFRQFVRFHSDTHCFDCWRLDRDFTVTASLTVYNGNFNAIRHEGSKAFRNCLDASAIFTSYTRNLNPNFSGC